MLVKNWMSKPVVTIEEDDSMQEAIKRMKECDIRRLPVVSKDKLVGIVTDGDLKRASASDATSLEVHELIYLISKIKIKHLMTKKVVTVPFDYSVEEAAEILLANKISGVPVVDRDAKLVGIITEMDIFSVLISLTGVGKQGIQFAFRQEDKSGYIKELTDIIRKYNARMASILTTYEGVPDGYRRVYISIYQVDRDKLPAMRDDLRRKATLLYMIDHRENVREIYQNNA
jgi:acetoin utilization protein AcuB